MNIIDISKIITELRARIPSIDAVRDEPMRNHTSFKIGGPADIFVSPRTEDEVIEALSFLKENDIPFTVIGNGSNLLVSDKGIRGCVISLGKNFTSLSCIDDTNRASGRKLPEIQHRRSTENQRGSFCPLLLP